MSNHYHKSAKSQEPFNWRVLLIILLATGMISALGVALFYYQKNSASNYEVKRLKQQLDVLTGIFAATFNAKNPTNIALNNPYLRPGWLVKVYPPSSGTNYELADNDVGQFVLDETLFTLMAHENHDIQQPESSSYKLHSLYPVQKGGMHQFGIQFQYEFDKKTRSTVIADCKIVMLVNRQQIINQIVRLSPSTSDEVLITGEALVPPGMAQAELLLTCTRSSRIRGELMHIRIKSRVPGEFALSSDRDRFLHFVDQ